MPATDSLALGTHALAMLDELAAITDEPGRITRLFLSDAHQRSIALVTAWMEARGLDVTIDALATVRGRMAPGAGGSNRRLLVGSHIDTVIDAGKYDGCFGVVAALIAVEEIRRRGIELPFGIEVLAFGDEEGVRFPTALSSSSAISGTFKPDALALKDRSGTTLRDALVAFGRDPSRLSEAPIGRDEAIAYLEVHIEQGPVLEHRGDALGIVTSIAGASRFRISIQGEAGHSGTVPMSLRRDAFMALAELAMVSERVAREGTGGLVATIGRVEVKPGAVNVVPGAVEATLDIRAGADAPRLAAIDRIRHEAERIANRRGVSIRLERFHEAQTSPMDEGLQDALAKAVGSLGLDTPRLPSGAGHDAMAVARRFPTAMLFLRSKDGISHNPAEYSSEIDMGLAIEALIRTIILIGERARA